MKVFQPEIPGKVKTGFSKMIATLLVTKADKALAGLTGNASFPNPSPGLDTLQAYKKDLETKIRKAESGDRKMIAAREQARLNWPM